MGFLGFSSFEGIVSGGRGALGECGGISNPVHYVRVKRFGRWIFILLKFEKNQNHPSLYIMKRFGRWIVENIESKAR